MDQQAGLFPEYLQHPRVRVAERVDPDARDEIEVAAAIGVVDVAAFAARQNERVPGVILKNVIPLQVHYGLRGDLRGGGKGV